MSSPESDWRKDERPEHASELPEQAPLNFNHKLRRRARQLRDSLFKLYRKLPDQIGVQEATTTNFLSPLANALSQRSTFYMQLFINERASPCDRIRVASRCAFGIINEIDNELPIRQKLLDTISHVSEVRHVGNEAKEFAEYLLRKVPHSSSLFGSWLKRIIMGTRLHLHLETKSSPLSEVRRSLEEVNIACQDCINACEVEELNAQDWIRRRNQYNANSEQCYGNVERMHRMITLRKEEARILGFHSLAEFKAKGRMGKCAVCIKQLINDLRKQALESTPTRFDRLLRVKETTFSWTNWPEDRLALENEAEADILRDWDYTFCTNLGGQLVNWKKLSQYFEVHNTLNVTIQILSNLFGLKFREVHAGDPNPFSNGLIKVWQERVKIYSVWNDFKNEKDFLGYLYLDLFSREKKTILPGHYCLQAATSDQRPSSVIFMNITEAKTNRPTLLQHQQLCSLFNYFGLAVHNLVSCQQYGRFFQGAEEDFIEIPGALLEQFCWETKILECVGQHWSWNSEFSEIWERNQSNITSNADKPSETLDRDTIRQLQAWKANNEGLEKLKECQHAMFDMGYHRPEDPQNIPHSVIWSKEMTDRVSPFSIKAMEEIEDVWEWGQCSPKLDGLRMRYMGRQTKLLINECARDLFETKFKNKLGNTRLGRRFIETVLAGSSNSTGLYKLWDFLGRCPKPFDLMVGYSSLQDRGTGEEHECLVYWRQRLEDEASSQSTAPDRRRSEHSKHSENPKTSRDPKDSEKSPHHEESNRNCSTTNGITTPRTDTHPAANMDVAIRHPVFLGSTKLLRVPKGVATCHRQGSSPVAEGYVYVNDLMNGKGVKGQPSPRPASADLAFFAILAHVGIRFLIAILMAILSVRFRLPRSLPILVLWNLLWFVSMVFCITIVYLTGRSPTKPVKQDRSCGIKKVPTIRAGGGRFVVVKTACGGMHMSIIDWMMWKNKKGLLDPTAEDKSLVEGSLVGVSSESTEESISDDGVTKEGMAGPSNSAKTSRRVIGSEATEEPIFDDGVEEIPYVPDRPLLLGGFAGVGGL